MMKFLFQAIFITALTACSFKYEANKDELIRYLNNGGNGLVKTVVSGTTKYTVSYKPNELIFNKSSRAGESDALDGNYSQSIYFVLSVNKDGKDLLSFNSSDYDETLKILSFGLTKYITLKEDNTERVFGLSDFIYPRMYGSNNATNILLCFYNEGLKDSGNLTLYVNDFVNGNPQQLKFIFKRADINKVPDLKI